MNYVGAQTAHPNLAVQSGKYLRIAVFQTPEMTADIYFLHFGRISKSRSKNPKKKPQILAPCMIQMHQHNATTAAKYCFYNCCYCKKKKATKKYFKAIF